MEDQEIIDLFFQRQERAITAAASQYAPLCRSVAGNILRDRRDVEEVLSDTWMDAWNEIPPARPRSLAAFLVTIARRKALDRYAYLSAQKRGGGQVELAVEELGECIPAGRIQEEMEDRELSELINTFLRTLPAVRRRVFVCRYWYLDSIKEISRQLGFSESKVKSMLYRTRRELRNYLQKEGISV